MAIQTLETIKNWFRTGRKPKQTQFWDTWDSFRHKSEEIPIAEINGIDELLQNKADREVFENHLTDLNAHAESFIEKLDKGGFTGTAKNIDDRLSAVENPDRVLKFGAITLTGLNISIPVSDFAWVLNKTPFLSPDAYSETINAATTGMYRNDIVVGNNLGMYQIIQGLEGTTGTAAVEPSVPPGTIKLGFISVFGATVINSGNAPSIEKVTIVDNDRIVIDDSENSFSKKAIKFLNVKTALATFFETLFLTQTTNQNISGIKTFLTGKFGLRNVANTFTSFFTNANTASRTYTLQNRDGILLDNTDLSAINTALGTKQTVFSGVANYITKSINATSLGVSRLFDDGTYFGIGTSITPTKDITLGNQNIREIGIEESLNIAHGRDLTISAGRTINFVYNTNFSPLSQASRGWYSMASAPNGDIYAGTNVGDIYKQTSGTGNFIAQSVLGGANWLAMCAAPNGDIYAANQFGDIYKKTNGSGNFTALGQTFRNWRGMAAAPNGDIYAVALGIDVYKQTGGIGDFIAQSVSIPNCWSITVAPNSDVYVGCNPGDIYKQTGGKGTFTPLSQVSRHWAGLAATPNSNIYATGRDDIYVQNSGTGNFLPLYQGNKNWEGITGTYNGNVYTGTVGGDIYIQNNNILGTSNLDGGTLINKSGTGKGTGKSRWQIWTGQKTVSGTDMQILTKRIEIDESGNYTRIGTPIYADNTAALAGGLKVGMEYRTSTGIKMEVY